MDSDNPAERRRQQFLSIAARLVAQEGVSAVVPGQVADEAGCTRPLVYRYFPSIEDLLDAVAIDFGERVFTDLIAAKTSHGSGVAFDIIHNCIEPEAIGPAGVAPIILQKRRRAMSHPEPPGTWISHFAESGIEPIVVRVAIEALSAIMNQVLIAHHTEQLPIEKARELFNQGTWGILTSISGINELAEVKQWLTPETGTTATV